jgi:hypothetical protein
MFWAKILEFFDVDADPGIFLTMDPGLDPGPDPGWTKFGSGIKKSRILVSWIGIQEGKNDPQK